MTKAPQARKSAAGKEKRRIIPYQELLGNYDRPCKVGVELLDYTIPRAIREL